MAQLIPPPAVHVEDVGLRRVDPDAAAVVVLGALRDVQARRPREVRGERGAHAGAGHLDEHVHEEQQPRSEVNNSQ